MHLLIPSRGPLHVSGNAGAPATPVRRLKIVLLTLELLLHLLKFQGRPWTLHIRHHRDFTPHAFSLCLYNPEPCHHVASGVSVQAHSAACVVSSPTHCLESKFMLQHLPNPEPYHCSAL